MTLLLDSLVILLAAGLLLDGVKKFITPIPTSKWLRTSEFPYWRTGYVRALSVVEVAVALALPLRPGRLIALVFFAAVTIVGSRLVARTGACACRGVLKATSVRRLVARNGLSMAVLAGSTITSGGLPSSAAIAIGLAAPALWELTAIAFFARSRSVLGSIESRTEVRELALT